MTFISILLATIALAFALRNPLRACPWAFYGLAILLNVGYIAGIEGFLPRDVYLLFVALMGKCMLALALFVVVMFIGVFSLDSRIGRWLRPVRAELSIVAWICSLGHMAVYLASYAPRLVGGGAFAGNILFSFAVAVALLVLLLILGVTSFQIVKRAMPSPSWKRVQRLAYPFFGLVYVHLMLMLAPAAIRGGAQAQLSIAIYTLIFGSYAVLRIARALRDRRAKDADPDTQAQAAEFEILATH